MPDKLLSTNALPIIKKEYISNRYLFASGAASVWGTDVHGVQYKIPFLQIGGVMEVGRYIDFHYDVQGKLVDYNFRLELKDDSTGIACKLPNQSGTLAINENYPRASVQDVESLRGGVIKFIIKKVLGGLKYVK